MQIAIIILATILAVIVLIAYGNIRFRQGYIKAHNDFLKFINSTTQNVEDLIQKIEENKNNAENQS